MPQPVAIFALVLLILALIMQIVGVATPAWLASGSDSNSGLWSSCGKDKCNSFTEDLVNDDYKAVRAFGILGLLVLVGAVVVFILKLVANISKTTLIAAILTLVAAFCILIEFAVWVDRIASYSYGYSFVLTIVAFVLSLISGAMFLVLEFVIKE